MVDTLKDLKPGLIVFTKGKGFKIERISTVRKVTDYVIVDSGNVQHASVNIYPVLHKTKPGAVFNLENGYKARLLGHVTYEKAQAKVVPPGYTGGRLEKKDYEDLTLTRFVSGDAEAWAKLSVATEWEVDMELAMTGEGVPLTPMIDVKKWAKLDLMAYVIAVHGPMLRDDIMRSVAALEGKPWIPTSNTEYFSNVQDSGKKGRFYGKETDTTLARAGKSGRKQLFGLGQVGKARAKPLLAYLGEGPARAAMARK